MTTDPGPLSQVVYGGLILLWGILTYRLRGRIARWEQAVYAAITGRAAKGRYWNTREKMIGWIGILLASLGAVLIAIGSTRILGVEMYAAWLLERSYG